jgi:hypothetical protein
MKKKEMYYFLSQDDGQTKNPGIPKTPKIQTRERRKSYHGSECMSSEECSSSSTSSCPDDAVLSSGTASDDETHPRSTSPSSTTSSSSDNTGKQVVVCYRGPYIEQEEEREVLCNINNIFLTKKKLTQAQHMLNLLHAAEKGVKANIEELDSSRAAEDISDNMNDPSRDQE